MDYTAPAILSAAALPEGGGYFNLFKIGAVVLLLAGWAAATGWVDKDTDVVKTKREQWNLVTISGGLVAFVVLFAPPWKGPLFFVGLGFWLLIAGGAILAYVVHRNGRVVESARVLTPTHFKQLMSGSGRSKKAVKDKGQRVRLADHTNEFVGFPDDPEEAVDYQIVQDFLYDLLWRRVSDVDMLAGREKYRIIHVIDGVAAERQEGIPPEDGERIFRYLKRIAGLNAEEIRRPQRGRIMTALLADTGDMGDTIVQTSGTTAGERMQLHVQHGPKLLRTHELGLAPPRLEILRKLMAKHPGLFLLSAPAKCGLTTTAYAMLRDHDAYMQNLHTLERQQMLDLDNITQKIYDGDNKDVDFARQLQSVLRREPDVVFVSDCEDRETAQIATRAAADDRKIYMGIRANDSAEALGTYLEFAEDHRMAAKALLGVINQRLVRKLCEQCREAFRPDPATLKKLNLPADKIERFYRPPTEPILDKKGREIICESCQGTGYVGRTGVFELMVIDRDVAKLIAEGAPMKRIKAQCRQARMYYLQEEGLLKVIEGVTSLNEVLRALRESGK